MSRRRAVARLFLLWKKERYEALGYTAIIIQSFLWGDELFTIEPRERPIRHGDFIT